MAYPRFQASRAFKKARRTAGTITLPGNNTVVDIDNTLDLVLAAQIGDEIEYGVSGLWNGEAVYALLDVATIVAGTPVNYFSSRGSATLANGVNAWVGSASLVAPASGSFLYTLVDADIANGTVTLRLRGRSNSVTTAKTLRADVNDVLDVWAKNLGPADPN